MARRDVNLRRFCGTDAATGSWVVDERLSSVQVMLVLSLSAAAAAAVPDRQSSVDSCYWPDMLANR